ncbi:DUF6249 domain-containing protein [Abyssalbus ytuae]|uniref:DUF6249 domain-containing protein n=1 Tax=Abyssalbus ytuae TaxID=2926907 RepID=A0A9E6ZUF7_9FLAO|nr:DUF6249 domain-containing protein [Abyssalbus ytuae]UOB18013.1 hypothetical protein MQE35_01635 [Abyssalbus ytuae]
MEVIIVGIIFGTIFGIVYLLVSARNKERMALIEKGAEASIFYSKDRRITPVWKVLVLNLSLLLMGIGLGIFIAGILVSVFYVEGEVAYPGTIFLMAGIGLFTGFTMTKKLD